jgi:hypothetical protein
MSTIDIDNTLLRKASLSKIKKHAKDELRGTVGNRAHCIAQGPILGTDVIQLNYFS